jgi:hypothetical protein
MSDLLSGACFCSVINVTYFDANPTPATTRFILVRVAYTGVIYVVCESTSAWKMCKPWPATLNITIADGDLNLSPFSVEKVGRAISFYKFGSEEFEVLNVTEIGLDSTSFTANIPMFKTSVPDCACGSCAPCLAPSCCAQSQDGVMFATEGDILQAVYKDASPPAYRIWSETVGTAGTLVFSTFDYSGFRSPCKCYCDGVRLCSCTRPVIVGDDFVLVLTDPDIPSNDPPSVKITCVRGMGIGATADSEILEMVAQSQSGEFKGIIRSVSSNSFFTQNNGKRFLTKTNSFVPDIDFIFDRNP